MSSELALTLAAVVGAYLLGSVSGSLLLGRFRGIDIRTQGSGNAGGTNAFRTQGWRFALGTVLVDIGKGVIAVLLMRAAGGEGAWLFAAVLSAAIGHVWPVFHGFRGGKGAATVIGGLAMLWPAAVLPLFLVWLLVLLSTGYVGLSTVLAGLALPALAWISGMSGPWVVFAAIVAALLTYTHRSNLQRLRAGTEHRFERARVFARLFSRRSGANDA
jgi:glycerol-3-phosphate acyltransferase PlsY